MSVPQLGSRDYRSGGGGGSGGGGITRKIPSV